MPGAKEPQTVLKRASLLIVVLTGLMWLSACASAKRQTAYVTTPQNNGVTAFRVNTDTGSLKQILGSPYPTGISPTAIRVHPSGKFAYVSNAGEDTISLYKIDSTGALTEVTPRAVTGDQPSDILLDPAGKFLFTINSAGNTISAFSIDSGGALTAVGTASSTFGFTPIRGAIAPSGKFLYVANSNSASVTGYAIDGSGALTLIPPSPIKVGNGPTWIAIDPAGKFLYVANLEDGTFSGFTIDGTSGALQAMGGSPFPVGNTTTTIIPLSSLVVDASGKYLYITALNSGNNVYGFAIDGTSGVPTTSVGNPVPAGTNASFIVNDTSGKLIFVGNQTSNSVSGFKIDPASGVLTLISTTTTGSAPTSMVFVK
ncbi:MAG TPA: beta-propeller fold lactonase family protein [Terriglobales bacterium]|nr:beta-propeller fold lactonase family protein [Terriglobales bacterium]